MGDVASLILQNNELQNTCESLSKRVSKIENNYSSQTTLNSIMQTPSIPNLDAKIPNSKENSKSNENKKTPPYTDLSVVILGVEEPEAENYNQRFDQLSNKVDSILKLHGIDAKKSTTSFHRIGKYSRGKCRPIRVFMTSIWEKRKVLNVYKSNSNKSTEHLSNPKICDFIRRDKKWYQVKLKAKRLNEEDSSKSEVVESYSVSANCLIFKFVKSNSSNEWIKTEEPIPLI